MYLPHVRLVSAFSFSSLPKPRPLQLALSKLSKGKDYRLLTRWSSSSGIVNPNEKGELAESTLLLQQGTEIQEIPLAVIRDSADCKVNEGFKPFIDLDPIEEAAFVEGFNSLNTPQQVLSILHTIPSQEVTPVVALSILKKLFELENNFVFRNNGKSWVLMAENSSKENFIRMAIVSRLIDVLILGKDNSVLLEALNMLRYDRKSVAASVVRRPPEEENDYLSPAESSGILEFSKYRSKLCDQVLIRNTKGELSLEQACRAVCILGQISQLFPNEIPTNFIDKMWVGISEKADNIDEKNILAVFGTVQYFQKSQRLVMSMAERKFLSMWWKVETATVAKICSVLLQDNQKAQAGLNSYRTQKYWGIISNRLLATFSKSISMNLHQLKDDELLTITKIFYALDFCDTTFEKTLSKFVKAKCLKISNPTLIATIMDYVRKFRIRSYNILDGVAEYLILHNSEGASTLSPPQLSSILIPYGYLDYQPPHATKFWEIAEPLLSDKFVQFPPKEIIESLLSCIYLQKYPLNFVSRVFSPYFLDRLHTSETDISILQQVRSSLKLLDTALTLECGPKYNGPHLPRDFTAKSVCVDGRVVRMISSLEEKLPQIYDPTHFLIKPSVVLPNLPLNALYIVDFVVSPARKNFEFLKSKHECDNQSSSRVDVVGMVAPEELQSQVVLRNRFNIRRPDSDYYVPIKNSGGFTAILINIPEHYASDGKTLVGPQVMRVRHLKLLGFNVVNLNYETLASLRNLPEALMEYLKSQIRTS